jgi:hypothetical protein
MALPSSHPLTGRELRELRRHQRESAGSPFVFVSERGAPLTAPGFSRMVERAAVVSKLGIKAHAHMLRHAHIRLAPPHSFIEQDLPLQRKPGHVPKLLHVVTQKQKGRRLGDPSDRVPFV